MLYTSGTTGAPKGVRKARPAAVPEVVLRTRLARSTQRYGWPPGPGVHLVVAPLHHAAPNGFAMSALHRGHTVVLMARWRPDEFLELVERHRVTSSHMVPTMFHRLLALPPEVRAAHDVSSLNFVVHAGAPCPVAEKRAMLDWLGPVVHEYYSSTEGGGTAVRPEEWLAHPGSVGRAWEGAEVRILDDEGMAVPTGTVGGVWMRNGDGFEYFRDPEKTAGAWRDGFFTAGDLGRLDADGYLYLADRRVDLILSGGVNIYPAEVEQALLTHPAVADAGVIGVPDADWGQRVHAVVELAAGYEPSETLGREILVRAAEELARFKRPRSIAFGTLPRTDTGKLRRRLLPAP
jgi:long-chain acyl-CoA synthetase